MKVIQENRKAYYDYDIQEQYEAGIKLTGAEVKSAKNGGANLRGSYVQITTNGVPIVVGMHISRYAKDSSKEDYDPTRSRVLLMHKKEINKILGKLTQKKCVAIPISLKIVQNMLKLDVGIGISKKNIDKREVEKKRDVDRDIERTLKNNF